MRKYVAYKITAANVDDLYEKYKEWINTIILTSFKNIKEYSKSITF